MIVRSHYRTYHLPRKAYYNWGSVILPELQEPEKVEHLPHSTQVGCTAAPGEVAGIVVAAVPIVVESWAQPVPEPVLTSHSDTVGAPMHQQRSVPGCPGWPGV